MSPGWRQYYGALMIARALLTYLIFIDVAYNAKLLNLSDAFKQQQQPLRSSSTSSSSSSSPTQRRSTRSTTVYYLANNDNNANNNSSKSGGSSSSSSSGDYLNDQPATDQCCACDEAKYELVFEGLWSRYTHPDDFPENYWLAHFSDIIGASHSQEFRMWNEDTLATDGVRELAETGSTKKLEAELKQVSSKTRTIIKARELRYPHLNGKTSAVFRTDRQHHLVSILSKLNPSPDWILGVSGLELCQQDCGWATQRVVNLYLWDAGTDSGGTFTAPDLPTRPQERIHPQRKESPPTRGANSTSSQAEPQEADPQQQQQPAGSYRRGPFDSVSGDSASEQVSPSYFADSSVVDPSSSSDTGGGTESSSFPPSSSPSKPYARLTITRQRIYEKSCTSNGNEPASPLSAQSSRRNTSSALYSSSSSMSNVNPIEWAETTMPSQITNCRYTDWSDWSTCSSNCGKGIRTRTRGFMDEQQQQHQSANNHNQQTSGCLQMNLIEKEICLSECIGNITCVTRDWSEWSRCSVTCGQGIRRRTRSPIGQMKKACGRIELTQTEACVASHNVDCSPPPGPDSTGCELSEWSQWSKCSVACGKGTRIRTRQHLRKDGSEMFCNSSLIQKAACTGRLESCADNNPKTNDYSHHQQQQQQHQSKVIQQQQPAQNPNLPVIDCKLSPWSPWSTCSALCGEGKRTRSRYIVQMPQNGGKPCDKKLSRTQKCKDLPPCPPIYPLTTTLIKTPSPPIATTTAY